MNNAPLGYGSFFTTLPGDGFPEKTSNNFLGDYQLFYAGRPAMKYAIQLVSFYKKISTVWLPEYYCPFVKDWINHEFSSIKYYSIDPFDADASLDWSAFNPKEDLIIINNYWGVKQTAIPKHNRPVVIEDHSHGWLSDGCVNSAADLCFASLRKTLPLPLGGIFWKPEKSTWEHPTYEASLIKTPTSTTSPMDTAWELMHTAMTEKALYNPSNNAEKPFISTYNKGEDIIREQYDILPVSKPHKAYMETWFLKDTEQYKRDNLNYIVPKIVPNKHFRLLEHSALTPFGLILIFKNEETLTQLKTYLISKAIYPAALWPKNNIPYTYKYLLNIHVDFRYASADMEYIAECINNWLPNKNTTNDI